MSRLGVSQQELEHALESQKIQAGHLGKFFGTGDQPAKTITGVVIFVLLVIGLVALLAKPWTEALEFWKVILNPLLTLSLGYLFGVNRAK